MRYLTKYGVNGEPGSLDARNYVEIALNSTETKPTEMIADGSIALETDTGNLYIFSETAQSWNYCKTVMGG